MAATNWTSEDERQALVAHAAELMAQAREALARASMIAASGEAAPIAFVDLASEEVVEAQRAWRRE